MIDLVNEVVTFLKSKKCVTIEDLIRNLGMSIQEVNTLIGILVAEGIVEEVELTSNCESCSLNTVCTSKNRHKALKVFKLREGSKLMK
ncbi:MAG: helix-turn-helix domain-containing protein [Sulfolobales archaeon]